MNNLKVRNKKGLILQIGIFILAVIGVYFLLKSFGAI
jgi:hypothetical protein